MKLLLDTNAFIWWLDDPTQIAQPAREAIEDGSVEVAVSSVTAFEIRTKAALGKLTFDGDIAIHLELEGFDELPVTIAHAVAAGSLPPIHKDPFDRLLIGQAQHEHLTIATRDATFQRYGVPVLAA
jgi:PIN domain nuclease of toxin-antitoxin system